MAQQKSFSSCLTLISGREDETRVHVNGEPLTDKGVELLLRLLTHVNSKLNLPNDAGGQPFLRLDSVIKKLSLSNKRKYRNVYKFIEKVSQWEISITLRNLKIIDNMPLFSVVDDDGSRAKLTPPEEIGLFAHSKSLWLDMENGFFQELHKRAQLAIRYGYSTKIVNTYKSNIISIVNPDSIFGKKIGLPSIRVLAALQSVSPYSKNEETLKVDKSFGLRGLARIAGRENLVIGNHTRINKFIKQAINPLKFMASFQVCGTKNLKIKFEYIRNEKRFINASFVGPRMAFKEGNLSCVKTPQEVLEVRKARSTSCGNALATQRTEMIEETTKTTKNKGPQVAVKRSTSCGNANDQKHCPPTFTEVSEALEKVRERDKEKFNLGKAAKADVESYSLSEVKKELTTLVVKHKAIPNRNTILNALGDKATSEKILRDLLEFAQKFIALAA